MSLYHHLKQFHRTSKQLQLSISQLLELFLIQMSQANLENLLLVESMSQLHQHKNIVLFCLRYHVFPHHFDQRLYFEKLHYRIVLDHF